MHVLIEQILNGTQILNEIGDRIEDRKSLHEIVFIKDVNNSFPKISPPDEYLALSAERHRQPMVSTLIMRRQGYSATVFPSKMVYRSEPSLRSVYLPNGFVDGIPMPAFHADFVTRIAILTFLHRNDDGVRSAYDQAVAKLFALFSNRIRMRP